MFVHLYINLFQKMNICSTKKQGLNGCSFITEQIFICCRKKAQNKPQSQRHSAQKIQKTKTEQKKNK